jgi:CelD/BcsL family acetyltransferase involved in cellulose biosynthesis
LKQTRAIALETLSEAAARPRAATAGEARPFAICEVLTSLDAARAPWAELESRANATPYQGFAFLEAWVATIGRARRIAPLIIVARDASGRPDALLPFASRRIGPLHIGEFLGGKDSNFNMGLFRPGLAVENETLVELLRRAAAMARPRLDGFLCLNQPSDWQGAFNPMITADCQASPSFAHKTTLGNNFSTWFDEHYSRSAHKKVRKKEQRLNEAGPVRHVIAQDAASEREILAEYAAQKEARMRELGLLGAWHRDQTSAFLARASRALSDGPLELHALYCGDRVVATFGGMARDDRFCGMLISYDPDPQFARCSPGEILLNEIVRDLIARRFAAFDLGVGEARYKAHCCEEEQLLFDSFIATSPGGRLIGVGLLAKQRVKRYVKQSPRIWGLVERLRRAVG